MSGGGTTSLGGGTTQHNLLGGGTSRLGDSTVQCQTAGGGTARTPKFRGFKFWALNLNPFGAYKYPNYSYMDKQEILSKIL